MSAASAKAAPLKLSEFLRVVVSELRSIANGFAPDAMKPEYSAAASESYIGRTKRIFIEARALEIQAESLEAPPAAERTALIKELRADISRMATTGFNASGFKKHVIQEIDLIMGLDAQEKAGVKAEICNAWHGNDFSQCQLPKGHEGNHLCIMTWEWPTASNAASEHGGAI